MILANQIHRMIDTSSGAGNQLNGFGLIGFPLHFWNILLDQSPHAKDKCGIEFQGNKTVLHKV